MIQEVARGSMGAFRQGPLDEIAVCGSGESTMISSP
jgi:hypothetical protein